MRRLLIGIALATLVCSIVCGPALASTVKLSPTEQRVLQLVNCERAKRDLAPLHVQYNLMRAARVHSRTMATVPFFSHVSPSGLSPCERAIAFGYTVAGCRSWSLAENIAWGYGSASTAEQIVRGWMNSPSHRRNILTAAFRDIGIGVAQSTLTPGGRRVALARYFTIDLARRIR